MPYQISWPKEFLLEKERIQKIFDDKAIEIEHIGSTSVEGLPSKPIIDMAVMIDNHEDADSFTEPLAKIGYKFHSSSTERHFYRKGDPIEYHLSIAYTDRGGFWPRQILFRDYLRSHPEACDGYANLKKDLLRQDPTGVGEYLSGKTEFVNKILKLAGYKDGHKYERKDQIESAKKYASEKFAAVGIKNHFLDVFQILQNDFGVKDQNILVAGLLHDTLEDTSATYEEIARIFSRKVADLVREVSHPKNYTDKEKTAYYEMIKTISPEAKLIKLADFTSHLRNFTKIYERGEQRLYPKFINNDKYITSIREFLESCNEPTAREKVRDLMDRLEALL